MPRLRSVDTIEYGFLLASIVAAGAAQFPSAGLAVQRVLSNIVLALGEPPAAPPPSVPRPPLESPYSAYAPPNGKDLSAQKASSAPPPACPAGAVDLGPSTPRDWWLPLLPEFDARTLAGRLDAQRESAAGSWR